MTILESLLALRGQGLAAAQACPEKIPPQVEEALRAFVALCEMRGVGCLVAVDVQHGDHYHTKAVRSSEEFAGDRMLKEAAKATPTHCARAVLTLIG